MSLLAEGVVKHEQRPRHSFASSGMILMSGQWKDKVEENYRRVPSVEKQKYRVRFEKMLAFPRDAFCGIGAWANYRVFGGWWGCWTNHKDRSVRHQALSPTEYTFRSSPSRRRRNLNSPAGVPLESDPFMAFLSAIRNSPVTSAPSPVPATPTAAARIAVSADRKCLSFW